MKSTLLKLINQLQLVRETEIARIKDEYNCQIKELEEQCHHVDDDGVNALIPVGYPFHSGWDECQICGKFIETNEYGRDG